MEILIYPNNGDDLNIIPNACPKDGDCQYCVMNDCTRLCVRNFPCDLNICSKYSGPTPA